MAYVKSHASPVAFETWATDPGISSQRAVVSSPELVDTVHLMPCLAVEVAIGLHRHCMLHVSVSINSNDLFAAWQSYLVWLAGWGLQWQIITVHLASQRLCAIQAACNCFISAANTLLVASSIQVHA